MRPWEGSGFLWTFLLPFFSLLPSPLTTPILVLLSLSLCLPMPLSLGFSFSIFLPLSSSLCFCHSPYFFPCLSPNVFCFFLSASLPLISVFPL